jgi:hypothetical protein
VLDECRIVHGEERVIVMCDRLDHGPVGECGLDRIYAVGDFGAGCACAQPDLRTRDVSPRSL